MNEKKKNEKKFPYYYKDYKKHVTIYKNGNGIIINTAKIVVQDINKFDKVYRKIDIGDGKKDSYFPSLKKMMKLEKQKRFEDFGFWYFAEKGIIDKATEYYWLDTDVSKEDKKAKNNPKKLYWTFEFNRSKINEDVPYEMVYVISIKGMHHIVDGVLDMDSIYDSDFLEDSSSEFNIIQTIENFEYIVSFEDGIELLSTPQCTLYEAPRTPYLKGKPIPGRQEYNVLFQKYYYDISKPIVGSKIKVSWRFKTRNISNEE